MKKSEGVNAVLLFSLPMERTVFYTEINSNVTKQPIRLAFGVRYCEQGNERKRTNMITLCTV